MSDSLLLVNQMNGKWKVNQGAYKERSIKARALAEEFKSLEFRWIPREMNSKADGLTREAYESYLLTRRSK